MSTQPAPGGMSGREIIGLVNRYIGVKGGYLGDFSYRTLAEFYPEYCGLEIDPFAVLREGTSRQRFIAVLESCRPDEQAAILRGVVERCPPDQQGAPATRTVQYRDELLQRAAQLAGIAVSGVPAYTSETVHRALDDAELLLRAKGPTSALDRVHTALQGWLRAVARDWNVAVAKDASMSALLKALRGRDGPLAQPGCRPQDIDMVLNGAATILTALDPVRNRSSLAHPNEELLDSPEAMLVINVGRSILLYLDAHLAVAQRAKPGVLPGT